MALIHVETEIGGICWKSKLKLYEHETFVFYFNVIRINTSIHTYMCIRILNILELEYYTCIIEFVELYCLIINLFFL